MKTDNNKRYSLKRSLLAVMLMSFVGLATVGCGEAVSVDGIDTGGGGGGTNSLMLNWSAPTTNEDGSPLNDLAGYKLYYGSQPGQYTKIVTVGAYTTAQISDLDSGTWYLCVTAYDMYGNESDYSDEIYHTFN